MQFLNNEVKSLVLKKFFISRTLRNQKRPVQIYRSNSDEDFSFTGSDWDRGEEHLWAELLPFAGGETLWLLS